MWHSDEGELTTEMLLAGGLADQINLKGYLHDFGHTMSLPHIGPNDAHGLGAGTAASQDTVAFNGPNSELRHMRGKVAGCLPGTELTVLT